MKMRLIVMENVQCLELGYPSFHESICVQNW